MSDWGRTVDDMETGGSTQQSEYEADDRDLVLAFQRGCPEAYEAIYRRHEARVRATCTRMLGQHDDAQEAVQETFLRAYQALGRFNGRYQLGAWLGRIATNVCVDQIRASARRTPLTLEPSVGSDIADPSAQPEEIVTGRDPRVRRAIAGIQPLHARALELRAVHGMSHNEMASRLSMSPSQVKALLHRARRSFRRAFERAGQWVAAPLLGMRSRAAAPGHDSVLLAGGPAGGALAERAVAGIVLAALAFSGLPGDGSGTIPIPPETSTTDDAGAVRRSGTGARVPGARGVGPGSARRAGPVVPASTAAEAKSEQREDFVARIARTVEGAAAARPPMPPEEPPEEPGEGPVPGVPSTSEVDVVEKVKKVVEQIPRDRRR